MGYCSEKGTGRSRSSPGPSLLYQMSHQSTATVALRLMFPLMGCGKGWMQNVTRYTRLAVDHCRCTASSLTQHVACIQSTSQVACTLKQVNSILVNSAKLQLIGVIVYNTCPCVNGQCCRQCTVQRQLSVYETAASVRILLLMLLS